MNINFKDYKSIVDNLHEGIIIFDANFKITFFNNFFTTLFEFSNDEAVNSSLIDLIDKRYLEMFKNHIKYNFDKSIDIQLNTKTNKNKYIRVSFNKFVNEEIIHTLAIIEDITKMRHEEVKKLLSFLIRTMGTDDCQS